MDGKYDLSSLKTIFFTLMKLKQNYTNLHLAQLFACSVSTVANIVIAANNLKAHSDHNLDFKVCTKNHKHFID